MLGSAAFAAPVITRKLAISATTLRAAMFLRIDRKERFMAFLRLKK
jgi:hypothetical protein